MKQKILCLIMLVCCMSFFSSANEYGKQCKIKSACKTSIQLNMENLEASAKEETRFNFSPMDVFVLSI